MSKEEQQNETLAFKDFKNAVPLVEFNSILKIARHEYEQLLRVHTARENFNEKSEEGLRQIQEQSAGMPPGLAEKLIEGLARKADDEVLKGFEGAIQRHRHITDFLNRFQTSKEILPYLDFNALKIK